MLLLVAQIASLVYGIVGLATGKLKLTKKSAVEGRPARIGGAILCLPLPLAFAVGFGVSLFLGPERVEIFQNWGWTIDLGLLFGAWFTAWGVAVAGRSTQKLPAA
jgi:hypothetical protein